MRLLLVPSGSALTATVLGVTEMQIKLTKQQREILMLFLEEVPMSIISETIGDANVSICIDAICEVLDANRRDENA